jgi:hypothetical protein
VNIASSLRFSHTSGCLTLGLLSLILSATSATLSFISPFLTFNLLSAQETASIYWRMALLFLYLSLDFEEWFGFSNL